MKAIVLGGSGSVGKALIAELLRQKFEVVALVRKPLGIDGVRELPLDAEVGDADALGFSTLGVGSGTAKLTLAEHRAVDVTLNEQFARMLKARGVKHLAFMSAAGANPSAKETGSGAAGMARYARVKGDAEEAVKAAGPPVVSVFRPAMIIGSQHTPWLLEKILPVFSFLTPKKYRSISVEQIAKAMIAVSLQRPSESLVYHYPEMIASGRHADNGPESGQSRTS